MSNNLPFISSNIPKDLRTFLDRVRESLFGVGVDRAVTIKDLIDAGIIGVTPNGTITSPKGVVGTPPTPTNLAVSGALANIILTWDQPLYTGHAYTEVWTSTTNDIGTAVLLAVASGATYADAIGSSATRYYWIRFVNVLGTTGRFNDTSGVSGTTGNDPDYLMGILTEAYGGSSSAPFFQIDAPTVINGVTIPAGTYIKQGFIADATISRAKIQDLAVDSTKIADAAIITAKIQDAAITTAKIGSAQVATANIQDAAITAAKIEDAAITTAKIQDASISLAKIDTANITTLSAITANMGTITAGKMQSNDGTFIVDLTNKFISITV